MQFPPTHLLLLASAHAHVSMVYLADQPASIRNADSATGNGRASVNCYCGGVTTFGSNGIGIAQDGQIVTLGMRYSAGHNGAFRMAYACDTTRTSSLTGVELESAAAMLTAGANECTVQGAAGEYGNGGATAVGQQVMQITCTLPLQNNVQPISCIMGILDQRDWGGCLDVSLVPAQAALPPSPPPAPFVTSAGAYYLQTIGKVDTAAGFVIVGDTGYTFTCCAIGSGQLIVPTYAISDGGLVTATFSADAQVEGCPVTTPDKRMPPPANTATHNLSGSISLIQSEGGNKLTSTATMVGQPFEVAISQGILSLTNIGYEQPILCDGVYHLGRPDPCLKTCTRIGTFSCSEVSKALTCSEINNTLGCDCSGCCNDTTLAPPLATCGPGTCGPGTCGPGTTWNGAIGQCDANCECEAVPFILPGMNATCPAQAPRCSCEMQWRAGCDNPVGALAFCEP